MASLVTARHGSEFDFPDKTSLNKMFKNLCRDLPSCWAAPPDLHTARPWTRSVPLR
jgi:hypothetical protein